MSDGLLRDERGVRRNVRKQRSEFFSKYHRTLPKKCYATDIDFLEYRVINSEMRPVCILEEKEWHVIDSKLVEDNANFKIIKNVARQLKLPFWVVWWEAKGAIERCESCGNIIEDGRYLNKAKIWDTSESKDDIVVVTPEELEELIVKL
jgi:hypothetical protein